MDDQKRQIIEKLQGAKNVLVTVSSDPSVDQLAACIALTLMLNKLDKHATAVYSGKTPSTIEFLKPEETLEKTTDSLRDFIIALDKAKADKLRYKVEEKVVKIFITPYRTSLNESDLNFSQGDFNVDVVIGIGVHRQQDLDSAITAHGRILHDATVATINNTPDGDLGSLHWQDLSVSSLSEQVASMATELGDNLLDQQIATALLTGIVAETARFSNNKTSPRTMSISAELMAAGANQQLVATQLEQGGASQHPEAAETPAPPSQSSDNGELDIEHGTETSQTAEPDMQLPMPDVPADDTSSATDESLPELPGSRITDVKGTPSDAPGPSDHFVSSTPRLMTEPPTMGGTLTANTQPEGLDPSTDPLSLPREEAPLLNRSSSSDNSALVTDDAAASDNSEQPVLPPADQPAASDVTTPIAEPTQAKNFDHETLSQIEQEVHHEEGLAPAAEKAAEAVAAAEDLDSARQAVEDAIKSSVDSAPPEPIVALGAQPVDLPGLGANVPPAPTLTANEPAPFLPPVPEPVVAPTPPPAPFGPPVTAPADGPMVSPLQAVEPTPLPPTPPAPANEPAPLAGSPADQPFTMPLPPSISMPPAQDTPPTNPPSTNPQAPPPVPPPMMPPGFGPPPAP